MTDQQQQQQEVITVTNFVIIELANNVKLKHDTTTNQLYIMDTVDKGDDDWVLLEKQLITKKTPLTWVQVLKRLSIVVAAYLCTICVIFLGAIPIWLLERRNERKTTGDVTKWTYPRSVYFVTVSVLTIGYGDMVPSTQGGKIYMMFYLVLGIGTVAALVTFIASTTTQISKQFARLIIQSINKILSFIWRRILRRKKDIQPLPVRFLSRNSVVTFYLTMLLLAYMLLGALFFWLIEDWSYFTGVWFVFVSLATVGYGDYYPTTTLGRWFLKGYACIGVGLLGAAIGLVATQLRKISKRRVVKLRARLGRSSSKA